MATRDVTARDMLHRAADWFPQGERVVDGLPKGNTGKVSCKGLRALLAGG